jgi:hypothetical protein
MFRGLGIHGITRGYCVNCAQYEDGEVLASTSCTWFSITIKPKGLNGAQMNLPNPPGHNLQFRLETWKDITHVDLVFADGHEYISVPWDEAEDFVNKFQTHEWQGDELRVTIKEET